MSTNDPISAELEGKVYALGRVISCPICLSIMHRPARLPCLHYFCSECLGNLPRNRGEIACPVCRQKWNRREVKPDEKMATISSLYGQLEAALGKALWLSELPPLLPPAMTLAAVAGDADGTAAAVADAAAAAPREVEGHPEDIKGPSYSTELSAVAVPSGRPQRGLRRSDGAAGKPPTVPATSSEVAAAAAVQGQGRITAASGGGDGRTMGALAVRRGRSRRVSSPGYGTVTDVVINTVALAAAADAEAMPPPPPPPASRRRRRVSDGVGACTAAAVDTLAGTAGAVSTQCVSAVPSAVATAATHAAAAVTIHAADGPEPSTLAAGASASPPCPYGNATVGGPHAASPLQSQTAAPRSLVSCRLVGDAQGGQQQQQQQEEGQRQAVNVDGGQAVVAAAAAVATTAAAPTAKVKRQRLGLTRRNTVQAAAGAAAQTSTESRGADGNPTVAGAPLAPPPPPMVNALPRLFSFLDPSGEDQSPVSRSTAVTARTWDVHGQPSSVGGGLSIDGGQPMPDCATTTATTDAGHNDPSRNGNNGHGDVNLWSLIVQSQEHQLPRQRHVRQSALAAAGRPGGAAAAARTQATGQAAREASSVGDESDMGHCGPDKDNNAAEEAAEADEHAEPPPPPLQGRRKGAGQKRAVRGRAKSNGRPTTPLAVPAGCGAAAEAAADATGSRGGHMSDRSPRRVSEAAGPLVVPVNTTSRDLRAEAEAGALPMEGGGSGLVHKLVVAAVQEEEALGDTGEQDGDGTGLASGRDCLTNDDGSADAEAAAGHDDDALVRSGVERPLAAETIPLAAEAAAVTATGAVAAEEPAPADPRTAADVTPAGAVHPDKTRHGSRGSQRRTKLETARPVTSGGCTPPPAPSCGVGKGASVSPLGMVTPAMQMRMAAPAGAGGAATSSGDRALPVGLAAGASGGAVPATGRRVPSRLQPWSCAACTFENPATSKSCRMCRTQRPRPPRDSAPPPQPDSALKSGGLDATATAAATAVVRSCGGGGAVDPGAGADGGGSGGDGAGTAGQSSGTVSAAACAGLLTAQGEEMSREAPSGPSGPGREVEGGEVVTGAGTREAPSKRRKVQLKERHHVEEGAGVKASQQTEGRQGKGVRPVNMARRTSDGYKRFTDNGQEAAAAEVETMTAAAGDAVAEVAAEMGREGEGAAVQCPVEAEALKRGATATGATVHEGHNMENDAHLLGSAPLGSRRHQADGGQVALTIGKRRRASAPARGGGGGNTVVTGVTSPPPRGAVGAVSPSPSGARAVVQTDVNAGCAGATTVPVGVVGAAVGSEARSDSGEGRKKGGSGSARRRSMPVPGPIRDATVLDTPCPRPPRTSARSVAAATVTASTDERPDLFTASEGLKHNGDGGDAGPVGGCDNATGGGNSGNGGGNGAGGSGGGGPEGRRKRARVSGVDVDPGHVTSGGGGGRWASPCTSWVLLGSALEEGPAGKGLLKQLAAAAGARVVESFGPSVTHVLCGTDAARRARRTFKYLLGVAHGCWVLDIGWAAACLSAGHPVAEDGEWAVAGDQNGGQCGAAEARLRRQHMQAQQQQQQHKRRAQDHQKRQQQQQQQQQSQRALTQGRRRLSCVADEEERVAEVAGTQRVAGQGGEQGGGRDEGVGEMGEGETGSGLKRPMGHVDPLYHHSNEHQQRAGGVGTGGADDGGGMESDGDRCVSASGGPREAGGGNHEGPMGRLLCDQDPSAVGTHGTLLLQGARVYVAVNPTVRDDVATLARALGADVLPRLPQPQPMLTSPTEHPSSRTGAGTATSKRQKRGSSAMHAAVQSPPSRGECGDPHATLAQKSPVVMAVATASPTATANAASQAGRAVAFAASDVKAAAAAAAVGGAATTANIGRQDLPDPLILVDPEPGTSSGGGAAARQFSALVATAAALEAPLLSYKWLLECAGGYNLVSWSPYMVSCKALPYKGSR